MREKVTIRQSLSHILRAVGILRRLSPGYFLSHSLAGACTALQPIAVLFFSAKILDELAGARDIPSIALYVSLAVGASFFLKVIGSVLGRRNHLLGSALNFQLRQLMGEHYVAMDYQHVEDASVNELLADVLAKHRTTGLGLARIAWYIPVLVERLCGLAGSAALLVGMFGGSVAGDGSFITSPAATWLLAASLAVPLALRLLLSKRSSRMFRTIFEKVPFMTALLGYIDGYVQPDSAAKEIRLNHQQPFIMRIVKADHFSWMDTFSRLISETNSATAVANAAVGGLTYLVIGLRALAGMCSIGQVTQYVGAVTAFAGNLSSLAYAWSTLWESALYLPTVYRYLDLPGDKYRGSLTTEKRADSEYEIEFRDVSFRYPGAADYALRHLNLKINVGQRLAVVGRNGSGKTTMIKLLCRLYDPTEGAITLNGIDIRKYDYGEYMGIFSVVFQDFKLPAFSLGQNVAAAVDFDEARVRETLGKVGFDLWDRDLGMMLYKEFDENGVTISGGEAQKIAIARAIYRDAPFVILDEPTAALDPISEYEIYAKLNDIVEDKTAVFISHRLSSCRFCHDIAVFHEGFLVQRGGHEELLADPAGKYHELWHAQAQYYQGERE